MIFQICIATLVFALLVSVLSITFHYYQTTRHQKQQQAREKIQLSLSELFPFAIEEPKEELAIVLIEPRVHHNLELVVRNIRQVFPNTRFLLFHGTRNRQWAQELEEVYQLELHNLHVENLSIPLYNYLLTRKEFYTSLPSKRVLICQTDAALFTQSSVNIEDYFQFAYVGAPWTNKRTFWLRIKEYGVGSTVGNGGLSLRDRSWMIRCLHTIPYDESQYSTEDVYFANALKSIQAPLPSTSEAAEFSFEHVYPKRLPFGAHKYYPKKFQPHITSLERTILLNLNRSLPNE